MSEDQGDPGFAVEMGKLFIIPAIIVAASMGVFILFGLVASDGDTARDYLQEVSSGSSSRKWQAAFELSRVLTRDEEARRDPRLGPEIVKLLQEPASEDPRIRRYLILALEEIGDPETVPGIAGALADPDAEVRLCAARALGRIGDPRGAEGLVALLGDEDPALRKMALFSLGKIGDGSRVPAMLARLDDPVEDVRWNAALSLAVLGDRSGEGVIRQMLDRSYLERVEGITENQKIEARLNAVQASYRLRDPDLKAMVEELSRSDPNLRVRDAALRALKEW